ncbi:MAG TPA: hypothetical protein VJT71_13180 [Pyrinomonadaceae bacterium]|nr:hypothetical protein [Pyrinomonadaceae bacterium]
MNSNRLTKILHQCVEDFDLNLRGLVVLTEAATGPYQYSPILAALAGADKVYAVTADSRYANKEDVKIQTLEKARQWGLSERIEVVFNKSRDWISECDIVTNSGFVRPINREFISFMKPTAVIPLMWETWELRDYHLDLEACKEHGILVLGTDEAQPPHALYSLPGYLAMKLIFELGLEGYRTRTLLLGSNVLARCIHEHFRHLNLPVTWFAEGETEAQPYDSLRSHFATHAQNYDVILVAEHEHDVRLLGADGLLTYDQIREANAAMCIGVISGNVDAGGLKTSGLRFYPEKILPFGQMSYQSYELGPLPVLELYAAGLKVGETMARARLSGSSVKEAARYALQNSAAMDFQDERAWL